MNRATAERLAQRLHARLAGKRIAKVWRTGAQALLLRIGGVAPERVLIDLEDRFPRVVVTTRWPPPPKTPDGVAMALRRALEGARIEAVSLNEDRWLTFALGPRPGRLTVQLAGRYPNVAVWGPADPPLAVLLPGRPPVDPGAPPLREGVLALAEHADAAWDCAFAEESWRERDARVVSKAVGALRADAKRLLTRANRAAAALERDGDRAADADVFRARGELLKTALGRIPRGAREIAVVDWGDPAAPTVVVPLDPTLSGADNMQRYFKRYRKYRDARAGIQARLVARRQTIAAIEDVVGAIDAFTPTSGATADETQLELAPLGEALARLGPRRAGGGRARKKAQAPARPYQRFEAADGTPILVGKSARANDELTFRVARGNDVWMHARDVAGSHVVLQGPRGATPSQAALEDAALLAAWHSRARGEAVCDVLWTTRKHVTKAKGAPAGRVSVASGRTIAVRPDPQRLARLYETLDSDR